MQLTAFPYKILQLLVTKDYKIQISSKKLLKVVEIVIEIPLKCRQVSTFDIIEKGDLGTDWPVAYVAKDTQYD